MSDKLFIIGASGHGKVVAGIAIQMKKWKSILFLDDDDTIKENLGIKVVDCLKRLSFYKQEGDFVVAIGNNLIREKVQKILIENHHTVATLIHPTTIIGQEVEIGIGTVVMPGVILNPCTKVGQGCIINTGAILDHDCLIGDYVHISPGVNLAGTISIDKYSWIGIGVSITNNVKIVSNVIIGAGAVVVGDIQEPGTYIGVPAKRIK